LLWLPILIVILIFVVYLFRKIYKNILFSICQSIPSSFCDVFSVLVVAGMVYLGFDTGSWLSEDQTYAQVIGVIFGLIVASAITS
jgi:hypothetical protein